jgi:hypothetical protein
LKRPESERFGENLDLWYLWKAHFPAGKRQTIVVTYDYIIGGMNYTRRRTGYILATGAGWKNPIGKAKIVLEIAGSLQHANVFGVQPERNLRWDGENTYTWEFTDLEPTDRDNIRILYDNNEKYVADVERTRESARTNWSSKVYLKNKIQGAASREGRAMTEAEREDYLTALEDLSGDIQRKGARVDFLRREGDPRSGTRDRFWRAYTAAERLDDAIQVCQRFPESKRAWKILEVCTTISEALLGGTLHALGKRVGFRNEEQAKRYGPRIKLLGEEARKLLETRQGR